MQAAPHPQGSWQVSGGRCRSCGISPSYLSRLESGERALDRRLLIIALAEALDVAPDEITGSKLALPREAANDRALTDVRHALLAVELNEPRGEVQPLPQLQTRVQSLLAAQNNAESVAVGTALPNLIRDLHASAAARHQKPEVLRLLTLTHMQGTQAWLAAIGAPIDLSWQAATLARNIAERLDEPIALGVASYGTALGLLAAGAFQLADRTLSAVELSTGTTEEMQLTGSLALASSLVSARPHRHHPAVRRARARRGARVPHRRNQHAGIWIQPVKRSCVAHARRAGDRRVRAPNAFGVGVGAR